MFTEARADSYSSSASRPRSCSARRAQALSSASRLKLAGEAVGLPNRLKAKIHFVEFLGDFYRYHLKAGALEIFADHGGSIGHSTGDVIDVGWRNEDMKAYQ